MISLVVVTPCDSPRKEARQHTSHHSRTCTAACGEGTKFMTNIQVRHWVHYGSQIVFRIVTAPSRVCAARGGRPVTVGCSASGRPERRGASVVRQSVASGRQSFACADRIARFPAHHVGGKLRVN